MKRFIAVLIAAASTLGTSQAFAQESAAAGPGPLVVTIIPGGATFFTEGKDTHGPSFGNYGLGGAVAVNFNRFIGVEGEVAGSVGITQDLDFASGTSNLRTPNFINYSGNVVVNAANKSSLVPYVTGGVGGLSLFEKPSLGVIGTNTFFTSNVGGGVNWYAGRWGLRGDYRFTAVKSKDDAPAFFGQETRYGHRIYGGVLLNIR
jgi:hypothetical protein